MSNEVSLRSDITPKFDQARRALARAKTVDEVKKIRNAARALETYLKQARASRDMVNDAQEIKLRAERKAGQMLKDEARKQGRPSSKPDKKSGLPPKLADMGVDYKQSERWQAIASVPDEVFEAHVEDARASGKELTSNAVITLGKGLAQTAKNREVESREVAKPKAKRKYAAIVIDPPWPMKIIEREERPNQAEMQYPTMTIDELKELKIPTLPDAHIYLWVTHRFLPDGLDLLKAWGFKYQCVMTWVKNVGITPFSWMYSTEHVLFGTRGGLPLKRKGLRLDFKAKVREHSRKPDEFYELVKQASPGPRIDMFSREKRVGFDQWGKEIESF